MLFMCTICLVTRILNEHKNYHKNNDNKWGTRNKRSSSKTFLMSQNVVNLIKYLLYERRIKRKKGTFCCCCTVHTLIIHKGTEEVRLGIKIFNVSCLGETEIFFLWSSCTQSYTGWLLNQLLRIRLTTTKFDNIPVDYVQLFRKRNQNRITKLSLPKSNQQGVTLNLTMIHIQFGTSCHLFSLSQLHPKLQPTSN